MKTLTCYSKEDIRIEEISIPEPTNDEILVKVKAALACGTDLKPVKKYIMPIALLLHLQN